jgi:hypothetical protein
MIEMEGMAKEGTKNQTFSHEKSYIRAVKSVLQA